jgi:hypothetical protein
MSEVRGSGTSRAPDLPLCFTFSAQHNAWALARGLERLGLRLEAVTDEPGLVARSDRQPAPGDVLFFTDERSLLAYAGQGHDYRFHPRTVDWQVVDDKLAWARTARDLGDEPVPFWELPGDGPAVPPELPIYLKGRHSWVGERRVPRGYVCQAQADVERALTQLQSEGWTRSQFFWQRLVSGPISNNFSVCGFHDAEQPHRSVMIVVQKVLGDGPTVMSCGAVVETVPDPANLLERASKMLAALEFTGPFEIEYLRDNASGTYYVLEFNPRFWMQHGLFVDGYDNAVISRYLGLDTAGPSNGLPFRSIAWVDTLDFFRRLPAVLMSDTERRRVYLDLWRRYRRGRTRIVCSPGAVSAALTVALEKARRLVARTERRVGVK